MGLFSNQFSNVVEWEEFREDMIFWKWTNREIKKGSKLIIRPGQDAIFMFNGRMEGIFKDDGDYDIESQIIPFLSTLKGFKFGFNSGMRAEVLFINTKEFMVKWGTRNSINIPTRQLPGGMPIRANGTFTFKVADYVTLIDKIAGVKTEYYVENVKERIMALLDQYLMKWIVAEGKDMFNLQANITQIAKGIKDDIDMQLMDSGLSLTQFTINSFNYPENIQRMIDKVASQSMIGGNMNTYQQVAMTDAFANGRNPGSNMATDMAGMMMGMNMANQMVNNVNQQMNQQAMNSQPMMQGQPMQQGGASAKPNFCPNCGQKTGPANFCPNCGQKLV